MLLLPKLKILLSEIQHKKKRKIRKHDSMKTLDILIDNVFVKVGRLIFQQTVVGV